jgi:hypothetical protein
VAIRRDGAAAATKISSFPAPARIDPGVSYSQDTTSPYCTVTVAASIDAPGDKTGIWEETRVAPLHLRSTSITECTRDRISLTCGLVCARLHMSLT